MELYYFTAFTKKASRIGRLNAIVSRLQAAKGEAISELEGLVFKLLEDDETCDEPSEDANAADKKLEKPAPPEGLTEALKEAQAFLDGESVGAATAEEVQVKVAALREFESAMKKDEQEEASNSLREFISCFAAHVHRAAAMRSVRTSTC